MLDESNDSHRTLMPSDWSPSSTPPSTTTVQPSPIDKTIANNWLGLLATYTNLLAQSPIRRENLITIEEYARRNGLWLMLDSVPGEVVAAEIKLRQAVGETIRRSEYSSRFPHLSKDLDSLGFNAFVATGHATNDDVADARLRRSSKRQAVNRSPMLQRHFRSAIPSVSIELNESWAKEGWEPSISRLTSNWAKRSR